MPISKSTRIRNKFERADQAWSRELRRLFGRDAGNARYEPRGRGEAGTELARIYAERMVAFREWQKDLDG